MHHGNVDAPWIHVDARGYAWTHVDTRGYAWTHVDTRGYTWIHRAGSRVCSPSFMLTNVLKTSRRLGATNEKMILSTLVRDGESEMQGNMEDITHRQTTAWLRGHPPRAARAARLQQKSGGSLGATSKKFG